MKLSDIRPALAALTAELDAINTDRDRLTERARVISAEVSKLQYALKAAEETPVALRPHVLGALGIESGESVQGS